MSSIKESLLTADRLRAALHYSPQTGLFTWLARPRSDFTCLREMNRWNNRYVGTLAGTDDGRGYVRIRVFGPFHRAHRLAWLYCYGQWPSAHVDHIDGDRKNNRLANLRDVSPAHNAQNIRRAPVTNLSTGVLGVQKHVGGFFVAKLQINGRQKHLGSFPSIEEAQQAYLSAKRIHHPGNTL